MNLLSIDPGEQTGYAIFSGEDGYQSGTWKNQSDKPRGADDRILWNGLRFKTFLMRVRRTIREQMIDAVCVEHNIMPDRSDSNAMLSGGWLCCIQIAMQLEREAGNRKIEGPRVYATSEWRSAYWGRYPMLPKEWKPDRKRAYHKQKALQACADEGWDVSDDNEAEALLMLVAFRMEQDPSFAFCRGGDAKAHQMGFAL